jgi:ergothioneine biosynthesis protein EgtB
MLAVPVATDKTHLLRDFQAAFDGFMEIIQPINRDPINSEDLCLQHPLYPEANSGKWHLGHALGWYWERFVLSKFSQGGYRSSNESIFNLYNYNSSHQVTDPLWSRNQHGWLRPRVDEVKNYVAEVRQRVIELLDSFDKQSQCWQYTVLPSIILGIQHIYQHQEMMLADLLLVSSCDPTPMVYAHLVKYCVPSQPIQANHLIRHRIEEGTYEVGSDAQGPPFIDSRFCWDNELSRHEQVVAECQIAQYLVTNRQYKKFIDDGGYGNPRYWSTRGFDFIQRNNIGAPLYWQADGSSWLLRSFAGIEALDPLQPVCNVSKYEAAAYASWVKKTGSAHGSLGTRLPTEVELEISAEHLHNFHGHVWQWTASPYALYPKHKAFQLAEMDEHNRNSDGTVVLRGSSMATPQKPSSTFRYLRHPATRTQFAGIRLAIDC